MKNKILAASALTLLSTTSHAETWVNPSFGGYTAANTVTTAQYHGAQNHNIQTHQSSSTPPAQNKAAAQKSSLFTATNEIEWTGRVNLGASLQTGNTEQSALLADAEIKAKFDEKRRAKLTADYNREKDDGDLTENNRSLDLTYDHFYKPQWFYEAALGLEQDEIEQLDLRTTISAGLGYQMHKSDDLNLQMVAGPAYLREDFENGSEDSSLAARWALDYDQKFREGAFQGFHNHELIVPTDDLGAYLFESKTGIRIPIHDGLIGTGEIEFDWNNDPEPGITEDDTKYAIKLGYEW